MPFFRSVDRSDDWKPELAMVTTTDGADDAEMGTPDGLSTEKLGTSRDQCDMVRLGKKQEFKARTRFSLRWCQSRLTLTSATFNSSHSLASVS